MQKDFHFYVTGILANHAGYSDDEAIVIATASQYSVCGPRHRELFDSV